MILRLLTWNIHYGNMSGPDSNDWPQRRPLIIAGLQDAMPDIFCAQEALLGQISDLTSTLTSYSVIAEGRDGPGLGEHCPIFFRTSAFKCILSGTFWFNDDTTRPGKTWDTEYNRICTWAELLDLRGGRHFRVWNIHFPLDPLAREKSIRLLLARIVSTTKLPTLVVGDFNEPNGTSVWPEVQRSGLQDAFEIAHQHFGDATFECPGLGPTRIDWILVNHSWEVHQVRTIGALTEHICASDHHGVLADLELVSYL